MPNRSNHGGRNRASAKLVFGQFARLRFSKHSTTRIQQRGYRLNDLEIIVQHGTPTPDGYFLRDRDVDSLQRDLECQLKKLEHLRGSYAVVDGNDVVSIYRPDHARKRSLLREARETGRE